ncbi:MAG: tRNA uridine-5-carboxymethylaminomethyl(34) synthesis GTPase MnmE [Peptoniphilus harei]|uniref:tRNA uridine-5-carboxymethylaminomethyl(34) synthesis GTPase MnmE n=1 Tax=Peptoniphilus harei TaxID=54005 RepID=UPI00254EC8DA|nr:tRNA uridine-5-carboxymethylaminomethyl(34) synthesis GTPase MnmE [Peptoniphilus harei]MDK7754691.1 tRNA uridine-5-carboxymethylaminomethyl(34) synthesis GTPase MnmE [Peptoniphilus harei]MDK7760497.1 tRNA uridine-5-carboxymethylaminomethyl(34) synthesis GTPase MnmE [Peptoniphilus harei]MDK8270288.1 tRNA uridine-5-carboxymethylaminomethyl(34) synthesis GTPase MnmE [Peptoniphilus harei]MDK8338747.1 tRNA uridine-5-carboxymethylaminomethyl(34) synthesis GTPase MnmE [Peptoniphilus harei]
MANLNDTIAAISTAIGEAGIAIVRMSGDDSVNIIDEIFVSASGKKMAEAENRKFLYGHIADGDKLIDEVLVVKMKGPHSYTAEDIVEIHCHGGVVSVKRILNLILSKGARLAERGEFTKRGFLNGRIDLTQAEAVIDMIKAKTDISFDMGLNQLSGALSEVLNKLKDELVSMQALIVANIDFPDEDIEDAAYHDLMERSDKILEKMDNLLDNSKNSRLLRDGINTVILGKPNVGKSSLLNGLLKYDRAIVTDIAGTTRDIIEDYINLDGVLLKITDTAGIRETDDEVEKIGVNIAREKLKEADLVIAIFDISRDFDKDDEEILNLIKDKKHITILNKDDLDQKISDEEIEKYFKDDYLRLSVMENESVKKIENLIIDLFFDGELQISSDSILSNIRHINALKEAKKVLLEVNESLKEKVFLDLIEVDLENVISHISEITGTITTEDILDRVFSDFCIGK